MNPAYLDTSVLLSVALGEPGHQETARWLEERPLLFSSNLLEAEFRSALSREGQSSGLQLLTWVDWVFPQAPLSSRFESVLAAGLVRGADLWHLACALDLREQLGALDFISADRRQLGVADELGFAARAVPPGLGG